MGFKPWLILPPQWAHNLSIPILKYASPLLPKRILQWSPVKFNKITFNNPLGIAGGVDKNAEALLAWGKLGCGFIEVGTITPEPQGPNPGKILDRDTARLALWNKMGFPNKGMESTKINIERAKSDNPDLPPLFINIGKNRSTPLDEASEDYVKCIQSLSEVADAFVVNISSPNTKDLRQLFQPDYLSQFLHRLNEANEKSIPLLLKLSPDISTDQLNSILDSSLKCSIDGWIFTNTTTFRDPHSPFPAQSGGVSGKPLAAQSEKILQQAMDHLGARRQGKLIVSVGGVMTPSDVGRRIHMGADLVQIYSALVFQGPHFFKRVSDHFQNIQ